MSLANISSHIIACKNVKSKLVVPTVDWVMETVVGNKGERRYSQIIILVRVLHRNRTNRICTCVLMCICTHICIQMHICMHIGTDFKELAHAIIETGRVKSVGHISRLVIQVEFYAISMRQIFFSRKCQFLLLWIFH